MFKKGQGTSTFNSKGELTTTVLSKERDNPSSLDM